MNGIKRKRRLTSFEIIILSFCGVILTGALLLTLPISSQSGNFTPFNEALFTATSAATVTGLAVQDTASYWSLFGQVVILGLIQLGGLGVITVAITIVHLSGKKISLRQRSTMQEIISAHKMGDVVKLMGFVLKTTFFFEALGALIMMPVFVKDFGLNGIWMACFHSVSAFCNAGFDIMGTVDAKYVSLTSYIGHFTINSVIMILIIIGGLGFVTWEDVYHNKLNFRRYKMQTKAILTTTAVLISLPALFFFFIDFADFTLKERILSSLFQSITSRTAGFNTADLTAMTSAGHVIIIILMLIGASPGSTAGGMKTTTIAVLIANAFAAFRQKEDTHLFGRRVEPSAIRNAATIFLLYTSLFVVGALMISIAEGLPMGVCLFETASAVATVGLSLGITPDLGVFSQCVLIGLMFLGRVGGLTLIYAAMSRMNKNLSKLPVEKITIG